MPLPYEEYSELVIPDQSFADGICVIETNGSRMVNRWVITAAHKITPPHTQSTVGEIITSPLNLDPEEAFEIAETWVSAAAERAGDDLLDSQNLNHTLTPEMVERDLLADGLMLGQFTLQRNISMGDRPSTA